MRIISIVVVFAAASVIYSFGTPAPAGPASQPATAKASAADSAPAARQPGRTNPFGPSSMMRDRARAMAPAGGAGDAGSSTNSIQVASGQLPVLEGVIVKDKSVLASFRFGSASIVVEPGATIGSGESALTFVSYENETAMLRNARGEKFSVQLSIKPSMNPPKPVARPADVD